MLDYTSVEVAISDATHGFMKPNQFGIHRCSMYWSEYDEVAGWVEINDAIDLLQSFIDKFGAPDDFVDTDARAVMALATK